MVAGLPSLSAKTQARIRRGIARYCDRYDGRISLGGEPFLVQRVELAGEVIWSREGRGSVQGSDGLSALPLREPFAAQGFPGPTSSSSGDPS